MWSLRRLRAWLEHRRSRLFSDWTRSRFEYGSPDRRRRAFKRLSVESLEPRQVLAGDLEWAASLGGGSTGDIEQGVVDADGNIYLVGSFENTADFDPSVGALEFTSLGRGDIYFAKYTGAGSLVWAKQIGGTGVDSAVGISMDGNGNVVLAGRFDGSVDFDPGAASAFLGNTGSSGQTFLARYDNDGNYLWARQIGDVSLEELAVSQNGEIVLAARLQGTADLDVGPDVLSFTSAGSYDILAIKFSAAGDILWTDQFGGSAQDDAISLTIDDQGKIILGGWFGAGTADFDPGAAQFNRTSAGGFDAFIVKLDEAGGLVWCTTIGGAGDDAVVDIATDHSGNLFVSGRFARIVDFDTGAGVTSFDAGVDADPFILKLNANGSFVWAKQLVAGQSASGSSVVVDADGNVLIGGSFKLNIDVDPGPGTVTMSSSGLSDSFLLKLDPTGGFLWAKQFGGPNLSDFSGPAIVVDGSDLLLFGGYLGTIDFDPGAGTQNRNSGLNDAAYILRLDGSGEYKQVQTLFGGGEGRANATAVDAAGNVYVTGIFKGIADFDPGAGTTLLAANGTDNDVFLAKYSTSGSLLWAKAFGGAAGDSGITLTIGSSGNVLLSGTFSGSVDFDTSSGDTTLSSSSGANFFLLLDGDGNLLWARQLSGSFIAAAFDGDENLLLTGSFSGTRDFDPGSGTTDLSSAGNNDVVVVKLLAEGSFAWARRVGGTVADGAYAVTTDSAGDVIVSGFFQGTVDFDPGAGVANLVSSSGDWSSFLWKLDAAGNYVWAKRWGTNSHAAGNDVVVTSDGGIIVVGGFQRTIDFDPNAGIANMTAFGNFDVFVLKFDADGNYVWSKQMGGTLEDQGLDVATDASGNIVISGTFQGTVDFDPSIGISNLTSLGGNDMFVVMLDVSGNLLWSAAVGTTDTDTINDLSINENGLVAIAGYFFNVMDVDPGVGVSLIDPGPLVGGFVICLDGNLPPSLVRNVPLTLTENGITTINSAFLSTTDANHATSLLTYTLVAAPLHGMLLKDGQELNAGGTFTQADIDRGAIAYAQSGDESSTDNFEFTVADAVGAMIPATRFSLGITSVNDAPTAGANLGLTLAEGATVVLDGSLLKTTDADNTAAQLVYTVAQLPAHGTLNLSGAALATNGTFTQADIDAGRISYTHDSSENFTDDFKFTVTDGEFILSEATFAFAITPVNDAPKIAPQTFVLSTSARNGAVVGTVSSTDVDGPTRTYQLLGGNGGLAIDASTGVVTVANQKLLVVGTTTLTVRVTDHGAPSLSADAAITFLIRKSNTAPAFTLNDASGGSVLVKSNTATLFLDENTPTSPTQNGALVGKVFAGDIDEPGAALPITMTDKSGAFAFDAATGRISVVDATKLNFEKTSSFTFTFKATDHGVLGIPAGISTTFTVTIKLADRNEVPTYPAAASTFRIKEKNSAGAAVGTVQATDPDKTTPNKTLSYAIVSQVDQNGNAVGLFSIVDSRSGKITVPAAAALNYEASQSYTVVVRASDGAGLFTDQTVTVQVIDVNEAVVLSLLDAAKNPATGLTVPENTANGTLVGYIRIENPDVTRPETFKITLNDNLGKAFTVGTFDAATRLAPITVVNVTKLNFEATNKGQFTLSFSVSDSGFTSNDGSKLGGITVSKTYNSLIADVNEAPTSITWKTVGLPSGSAPIPAGTVFGTAFGVDSDKTPQDFRYSLLPDSLNNDLFTIDPITGQLRFSLALARKSVFNVTIRVTDSGGLIRDQLFTLKT